VVALALSAPLVAGGCGGILSPDLFVVQRSGTVPGASVTVLVNEEGGVHCDGRASGMLSDPELIEARTIQEELKGPASKHLSLAPARGSVLSYRVRSVDGAVSFADNSAGQPTVLRHLAYLVSRVARALCHRPI